MPNHETGLVQCWKDAQYHCQGPYSAYCGGPVLAGSGDGPCANKQGGLGMYQFDAGTHAQTLAAYGNGILDLGGNVDGGLNVIIQKIKVCPNIAGVDTDAQAIAWLNTAVPGTPRFEEFLTAMAWCYNGCSPTACSLHQSRREKYRAGVKQLLDGLGHDYWYAPPAPPTVQVSRAGDFNGDGKADIITFTRGANADVFVSLSNGAGFLGASIWHDFWAPGAPTGEVPTVGDFNGDGKDDIVTFTRGDDRADVLVALSERRELRRAAAVARLLRARRRDPDRRRLQRRRQGRHRHVHPRRQRRRVRRPVHRHRLRGLEVARLLRDQRRDSRRRRLQRRRQGRHRHVHARRSRRRLGRAVQRQRLRRRRSCGTTSSRSATSCRSSPTSTATARTTSPRSRAAPPATSTSSLRPARASSARASWHDFFSLNDEVPGAGDFDGDGKADIITFTRGNGGDVFVSRSTGAGFGASGIWNDFFAPFTETPMPGAYVL